jgi:hypothetical protein
MFESLDGTGELYDGRYYKRDNALSGIVNAGSYSSWTAKPIPGLTSVGVVRNLNPWGQGGTVYFYYTRNPYTLDFYSHGQVVPGSAKTVKYGDTIEIYNFTPEKPADLPDHSFGGWYTTADCTPGTEFVWANATMPANNLRLFAKWNPPIYYVYFNYTKPDGTVAQLDVQQVPQGQKAVRPADPASIPGYDFDGWYYSGTQTKYSFDAQVFSTLTLTGRYLPKNDRTYTVQYLYADNTQASSPKTVTGQTTGSTVTEQAVEVSGYLPDALSKTITLGADNNLITFYYGAPNVNYTVRYLERDTGTELLPPVTKNSEGHNVVTETAPAITNKPYQMPDNSWVIVDFTPDRPQKSLTLTSNPELNVITFYYEYIIKNHYEVRYLEIDTDPAVILSEPKHVITAKNEVVELPKSITNYRPHSVVSTYPVLVRGSSANYISTGLTVSDPVSQPPQVITFYYMPERIEITGTKTWVDAGISAPDERPQSLSLTLYANDVALSPQPVPNWTDNGNNTWTYRYINLPAAVGGITQVYTVRETVPNNYIANHTDVNLNDHGGTNIINTLDGGTTTFSGTKTWVAEPDSFGFAPRPTDLELTFYRQGINDTGWVKMNPQPEYDWNKNASEDTWTYTVNGLKKYEDGHLIKYKAEETVPLGYEQILDNGQDFTNEIIYTTATVTWVNGPVTRPTIWLKIYQQVGVNGTPEPVTYTPLKELDSSTTEVTWRGLYDKDEFGNPYIFTVREVDAEGNDWTPDNYTKVENGLNVTNTYVIPTNGKATATKTWVNGSPTHPDLWLQLWRKTTTGTPLIDQPVPNRDPVKVASIGNFSHEWTGLETTDINGNAYTFYVKEGQWDGSTFTVGPPLNYQLTTTGDSLTLTNTYKIPTNGTFTATKIWEDGAQVPKPAVWFQLHRRVVDTETWEPVPGVTPQEVTDANSYTVTWSNLEETDSAAQDYEFGVVEGIYDDTTFTFTPGSPSPFDTVTGEYTDTITNTYNPPADATFTATKTWEGGPVINKTAVALDLYRHSINVTEELVTGVTPQITGESPTYTYTWENLVSRDNKGVLYTFTVKERDEDADNNVTINGSVYKVTYDTDKKNVTNTYQIPKDKNVTATKKWENGSNVRPGIWFKLQRRTPGGTWQDVPGTNAEHVPAGLSVTWTGQERTNFNGIEWEYSVIEGKLVENAFNKWTPDHFTLSGQGTLNLTNTYTIPTDTVVAKKEWKNGPPTKPTVWFKLQRAIPGGEPEDIPSGEAGSAILRLLPGVLSVQWENVKQTDIDGKAYTFSIVEGIVNEATQEFSAGLPASYEYAPTPMTGSLGVVNIYTSPTGSKTTKKIWAGGGPQPYPEVWLRLERTISPTSPFEVAGEPIKVIMPDGSTESDPVTWHNVALKDDNGTPYYFRVIEGTMEGSTFTPGTPANYVSDSGPIDLGQGLNVTNTWQMFDLSVEVIWDGAPAEAYGLPANTSTLSLYRWHEGESQPDEPLGSVTLKGNDVNVPVPEFGGRVITNGWNVTVADLPKNNPVSGKPYVYSVEQTGYSAIYTATSSVHEGRDWTFTNTFDKTTVEVFKKYEQTTVRPPVTIVLFQNGVEFYKFKLDGHPDGSPDSGEPYEKEAGRLILPNLPTRTLAGADAVYTVTELIPDDIPFPYQRVITGNATDGFLITNTYNNGRFTAFKRWNIGQTPLPESGVTFELWRWVSGSGQHYDEKMVGYNGTMDGNVDTEETVHDQDQNVRGIENREWEYTWFNLPLNGDHEDDPTKPVEYTYFVKEVPLGNDYIIDTVSSSSVMIKNVALKTDFTARKVWGGEPKPEVYLQLMRSSGSGPADTIGEPVKLDGVADDVAAGQSGELRAWYYTWTNLPRFPVIVEEGIEKPDINNPYTYTAKEVNSDGFDFTPDGYARYDNNSNRIINIQLSDVKASKIWVGGDVQRTNNIGPETYLTLYRRTVFQEEEEATVVPDADLGGQSATKPVAMIGVKNSPETVTVVWENMPWGTKEGIQYIYSVVETDVDGNAKTVWQDADDPQLYIYNTTYDENDPLKVTDTFKSPTREVLVTKVWLDENENPITDNSKLPESLVIKLTGSDDSSNVHNLVSNLVGNWEHTFTDLYKFDSTGKEITYIPIETMPLGYTLKETTGDMTEGFTLTNLYTPGKVAVQVAMDWDDGNDQDGFRPDSVTIRLLADGVDTMRTIDLTKVNHWTSAFTGLDQFKTSGEEIVYTIEDVTIAEYATTVTQENDAPPVFTVKSYHEPETVDVTVNDIIWMDENDLDGIRPASVMIRLFKNNEEYASKSITAADGWTWTFMDMPKREAGELITYTIEEDAVFEYTTTIDGDSVSGFEVTNMYTPIRLEGDVTISWDDADDQAGLRPPSVTVKLYADGKDTGKTLILTKADQWTGAFTDLPKYKNGKEVTYTVEDVPINKYQSSVSGGLVKGFVIIKRHTPSSILPITGEYQYHNHSAQHGIYLMLLSLGAILLIARRRKRDHADCSKKKTRSC